MASACSPEPGFQAGSCPDRHLRHCCQKQVTVPSSEIWHFSDGSSARRRTGETSASDENSLEASMQLSSTQVSSTQVSSTEKPQVLELFQLEHLSGSAAAESLCCYCCQESSA